MRDARKVEELQAALAEKDAEIADLTAMKNGLLDRRDELTVEARENLNAALCFQDRALAAEASLASAKQEIERLRRIISTYNKSGFADADAMAEKYLDATEEVASLKRELEEARCQRDELKSKLTNVPARMQELEREFEGAKKERDAALHAVVCPFDYCQRCIDDEQLMKRLFNAARSEGGKDGESR